MDTFGRTDLSETSKSLLNKLISKELTLPQFLTECAYWALRDGFEELRPHQLPTVPDTEAFKEYLNLPVMQKERLDNQFFLNHPEINSYYQQAYSIKWRNKASLDWLNEIKSYFPATEEIYSRKIEDRILEFTAFFDDNPIIVQKIKSTFQAREFKRKPSAISVGDIVFDIY